MSTVEAVFRYPVKSMLGTRVEHAEVRASGVVADRRWALVDSQTGKIASAKQPRLWRSLLQLHADYHESADGTQDNGAVTIRLPDGTVVRAGEPDADETLSRFVGRAVKLRQGREPGAEIDRAVPGEVLALGTRAEVAFETLELSQQAPGGSFVDFAPVHLITTATLAAVNSAVSTAPRPRIFRPNLIVATPELSGYAENDWVGRHVAIGGQVRLEIFLPTPRCAIPTLAHGRDTGNPQVLRALARSNRIDIDGFGLQTCAGVYAKVVRPGQIRAGDEVRLSPQVTA
ncbi:MAG TPA: MOSC N-terminal beta barrel domain-containing protein [Streptosporangiaceae bacterium]